MSAAPSEMISRFAIVFILVDCITVGDSWMSKVIRVKYENGVLKPLEPLELEEGEEVLVTVKRDIRKILKKYRGILGRSSIKELLEIEEEAHIQ